MDLEAEMKSLIKIWFVAILSLIYCYYIGSKIPKGAPRLVSLIPIIYLFTTLTLDLNTFHLGGPMFLFLVWLANFKLLLFAFDQPPLSPLPNNPFHFISVACLPIKIASKKPQNRDPLPKPDKDSNFTNSDPNPSEYAKSQRDPQGHVSSKEASWKIPMPVKVLILALLVNAYQYRPFLNPYVILVLYVWHMYLGIELVLALCSVPAKTLLGFEIEPQFNEPYLTTSLQDYWGRRWNLMVSAVLKPTCYEPVRLFVSPILGPKWAQTIGFIWAFTVSGLMHEAVYYYFSRAPPTWEVTWFFVLHGVATSAEVVVKRWWGRDRWRPSGVVSGAVTMAFLLVSGKWLFFPQLVRNGVVEKAIKEYDFIVDFFKNCV